MLWCAPHWDDLFLSLPRRLIADGRRHFRALVVFSDEDEVLEDVCRDIFSQLNIEHDTLGFSEAKRRGMSLRQTLHVTEVDLTNSAESLCERVSTSVKDYLADVVDGPVATCRTGVHIDHRLTRMACEQAVAAAGRSLLYYDDQPYSLLWSRPDAHAGLVPVAESPTERPAGGAIRRLLIRLEPFAGRRTVQRLIEHFEDGLAQENLWRLPDRRSGDDTPLQLGANRRW